jgi:hypothetical protein
MGTFGGFREVIRVESQLKLACLHLRQERPESLLKSEKEAVFSILRGLAPYTEEVRKSQALPSPSMSSSCASTELEEVHKYATTPDLQVRPMIPTESQSYDFASMSPKKPRRTPNASIAASLLQSFEDQREAHVIWMHGVGWTGASSREKLRKKSDLFLWRLSRRLIWAEKKLLGPKVADCLTQPQSALSKLSCCFNKARSNSASVTSLASSVFVAASP